MIPQELRTERLRLRQWREEDAEALAAVYAQPEFQEHNGVSDAYAHVLQFSLGWRLDGFSVWAADELETGSFVGRLGLLRHHDWPEASDPVEVGWVLHRDWWGRGLATEADGQRSRAGASTWTTRS